LRGWLAFRRYRTRGGGRFEADYLFRRTSRPTTYEFRAQVRESGGYPYLEGDSDPLYLRVLPKQAKAAGRRCPKGRRWAKHPRRGKPRCAAKRCRAAKARAGRGKARCMRRRCAKARRAVPSAPHAKRARRRARKVCAAKRGPHRMGRHNRRGGRR